MRVIEANDKNENINITVYLAKKDEGLSNRIVMLMINYYHRQVI